MPEPTPAKGPSAAGTFVVEIDVPEGFDFGHGQLGNRVSDALRGQKVAPYPLSFLTIRTSFRPPQKDEPERAEPPSVVVDHRSRHHAAGRRFTEGTASYKTEQRAWEYRQGYESDQRGCDVCNPACPTCGHRAPAGSAGSVAVPDA